MNQAWEEKQRIAHTRLKAITSKVIEYASRNDMVSLGISKQMLYALHSMQADIYAIIEVLQENKMTTPNEYAAKHIKHLEDIIVKMARANNWIVDARGGIHDLKG